MVVQGAAGVANRLLIALQGHDLATAAHQGGQRQGEQAGPRVELQDAAARGTLEVLPQGTSHDALDEHPGSVDVHLPEALGVDGVGQLPQPQGGGVHDLPDPAPSGTAGLGGQEPLVEQDDGLAAAGGDGLDAHAGLVVGAPAGALQQPDLGDGVNRQGQAAQGQDRPGAEGVHAGPAVLTDRQAHAGAGGGSGQGAPPGAAGGLGRGVGGHGLDRHGGCAGGLGQGGDGVGHLLPADPAQAVGQDPTLPGALGVQGHVGELSPAHSPRAGLGPDGLDAVRGCLEDLNGVGTPGPRGHLGQAGPHRLTGQGVAHEDDAAARVVHGAGHAVPAVRGSPHRQGQLARLTTVGGGLVCAPAGLGGHRFSWGSALTPPAPAGLCWSGWLRWLST